MKEEGHLVWRSEVEGCLWGHDTGKCSRVSKIPGERKGKQTFRLEWHGEMMLNFGQILCKNGHNHSIRLPVSTFLVIYFQQQNAAKLTLYLHMCLAHCCSQNPAQPPCEQAWDGLPEDGKPHGTETNHFSQDHSGPAIPAEAFLDQLALSQPWLTTDAWMSCQTPDHITNSETCELNM